MNQKLLALACIGAFAMAACTQQSADPSTDVTAAAPATEVESAPVDVISSGQASDSSFDQRAFAGTFGGTLPCADCPGIDATLTLQADGTYQLTQVYQERPDSTWEMNGNWTAEADNRVLRLDPNSKTDEDQLYAIDTNDRIVMLAADGQPAASGMDYSLNRHPAE
ncbi:MAG: copper resistance protein NlpE [Lysobacter sp.]